MRIKEILTSEPQQNLHLEAWVRTKRDSKNVCFIELSDGSCLKNLQAILDKEQTGIDEKLLLNITTGASVAIDGDLVSSPGQNQSVEVLVKKIVLIGEAPGEAYPLQKKRHSMEFLREIAHLRPRTNTIAAVSRVASTLSFAIHRYFQEHGFVWVRTPIITTIDAEGAGNMFQVTTLDVEKEKISDYSEDFFGKKAYLTVTGQLEAENYATALGNVYTFGPTFRAEHSNTSRHLAEFWMMEPEVAFCDINGNMDLAEDFLKYVFSYVLEHCSEDMNFFNKWVQKGISDVLKSVIEKDFIRITYTEAMDRLTKSNEEFDFKPEWGCDLQSEHEKYLTEKVYNGPVIITDYPRDIKAFYMKQNDDGKTVRAMDVLVPRLGEIIGGSERENNLQRLEARMDEMGLSKKEYWWYLELRKYGSVPHSGFGLGFERLVQYVTGMQNIRDVIPFPRALKTADF